MEQFNLGNFFNKVVDYSKSALKGGAQNSSQPKAESSAPAQQTFNATQSAPKAPVPPMVVVNSVYVRAVPGQNLKMNMLASLDRSVYIKDLMDLPKDMKDLLVYVQKNLAMVQTQAQSQDAKQLLALLNLNDLSLILQKGGKDALNKLVLAMSNASKQGISDLSQIKETMKLINACVSTAGQNNPTTTLKSLMLLYLPWLPLQDGVGFDLEIESGGEEGSDNDSVLSILIQTKNFGNIKAVLTLIAQNGVNTFITCSDVFPKEELMKRLKLSGDGYSMQSTVEFDVVKPKAEPNSAKREAKINMSQTNEINPFLLLMAHSIIRHTIEIDNEVG